MPSNFLAHEWESFKEITLKKQTLTKPQEDFLKIVFYAGALAFQVGIFITMPDELYTLGDEVTEFFKILWDKKAAQGIQ